MTLITCHDDPNYVAVKSFIVSTSCGNVYIEEADPVTLCRNEEENIFFGNSGTVLQVLHKTALGDLLSRVRPATFHLGVEEDGEMCLVATIQENETLLDRVWSRVEGPFQDVFSVESIQDDIRSS